MYDRMIGREDEGIHKLGQVINFAKDDDCLAAHLAQYFGDEDAVPGELCGQCSFCTSGEGVMFEATATTNIDPAKFKAILEACLECDDPRLLAGMAFGITSPRLTANNCRERVSYLNSKFKLVTVHEEVDNSALAAGERKVTECNRELARVTGGNTEHDNMTERGN
ncbi:hypothetical protein FISHEDRAFT_57358 [Fistulina hepatica ATCC 64428]|uniref:ATP-dependent DNA helicase RecQ zinc-binding domain-containing protein n=1 Tax=Fistulina hepatica ATCC 64428 TaxID=1128425 RepID=A0A0D7AGI3_9AGAR|nr:hypothetical protein FISHEDRAFT_57358 [Fistulina hepatica ATCC 64428]